MKKLYFIPLVFALASCANSVLEEETIIPEQEGRGGETETIITDLSAAEMANCYIVRQPGVYKFRADNQFNLGEGLPVPPQINVKSAKLVWQTVKGSITSIELTGDEYDPYIEFEVKEAAGNAILAAVDEEGTIQWSWHIWMPQENISSVKTATGYEVMNMNLGSMTNQPGDPTSYGMLYQWGRKDPFPASETLTGTTTTVSAPMYDIDGNPVTIGYSSWSSNTDNTLEYAISHPTICLSNYSQYSTSRDWLAEGNDALWGNPNGYTPQEEVKFPSSGRKTCYDPSPAGWRVAPADVFNNFTTSGGYAWTFDDFNVADVNNDGVIDLDDYNYGWQFLVNDNTPLYFPAAARFDGSYAMLMGSMSGLWGSYWSNAPYPGMSGGGFCCLSFQTKSQTGEEMITVSPSAGASRADAYSIRCIRDTESGEDSSGVKVIYPD